MDDGGDRMNLSSTTVTWRGLTFYGRRGLGPFTFSELDGWEELPPARHDGSDVRPQAHGRFDAPVWADERTVTLTGFCSSATQRDAVLAQLGDVMTWPSGRGLAEDLVITQAGRTLTGNARLTRYKATLGRGWAVGYFPYAVQWVCSDPMRYGAPVPVTTGFPQLVGGLEYDLYTDGTLDTGFLEYGAASTTGRIVVANPGNADAWAQYEILGPVPVEGFDILRVGTGDRLRFAGGVSAGSRLVIDSATGVVVIDGYADRSGLLTVRDWFPVPAKGSVEIAFVPLGAYSTAQLTATVSPGFW